MLNVEPTDRSDHLVIRDGESVHEVEHLRQQHPANEARYSHGYS